MIQKITQSAFRIILFFSIFLCTEMNSYAQTKAINPQVLSFDRICADATTEYNATFTYSGFPAGTVFVVELSTNNFTTIVTANTIAVSDPAVNQKTIKFNVPSNLAGSDTYSLRVSTTGFSSAKFVSFGLKNAFPIYYKAHDRQYTINNFNGTATFCAGGSILLTIDGDSTTPPNDSPLKYTFLTYNWYKDNGVSTPPTLMAGATGPSYSVSTEGVYYVETNYGTCTSESYSNRVTVSSAASGSSVTIDSSLGNPFCATGDGTVLTATSGNKYQWKKDGAVIAGATNRTYSTKESGKFSVDVDFGGCVATGSIDLKSNGFNASIDVAENNKIVEGETLNVSITTDAATPKYEWYLNGNLIDGATSGTYLVATIGDYKVIISQAGGCITTKEFAFKVSYSTALVTSVIPNILKLSGLNPYWNIPDIYKNANTKVIIISSNGDKVLDATNYQGDWPQTGIDFKNVNPVYYYVIQSDTGEKKGSITVIK
ncbi:gliding motility protein SprC [Flavobacterium sp. JAS]|uniref:gliding motility protein SprC n=1 Tax=Flavobacterium sp. JAS TaxID=2897329 RepID=UPI001E4CC086|nr:gliding motility protein SprC [Flavobacterium sp. JAS]MCD0469379.1 gliding motility protein SprC [Flavobacterium sp. JAS]